MYILFSLTRFPLLSARVDELDFCFFFDAGTEIFVEDHVHFIFSNGFSLVSKGRRIRFLSFLSTRAQNFLFEDWKIKISHGLEKFFLINAFLFLSTIGKRDFGRGLESNNQSWIG